MKQLLSITLLFSLQLYPYTTEEQQEQYKTLSQDVRSWNPVTMARLALCRPDQQQYDRLRSFAWECRDKSVLDHLEKTGYKTSNAAELFKVPFNIARRHKLLTVALLVARDLSRGRGMQSRLLNAWRRVQTRPIFNEFWNMFAASKLVHVHTEGYRRGAGVCTFSHYFPSHTCISLCLGANVSQGEPHNHHFNQDGSIVTTQVVDASSRLASSPVSTGTGYDVA